MLLVQRQGLRPHKIFLFHPDFFKKGCGGRGGFLQISMRTITGF